MTRILAGDPQSDRHCSRPAWPGLPTGRCQPILRWACSCTCPARPRPWPGSANSTVPRTSVAELREWSRDALFPGLLSYVLGISSEIELRRGRLAAARAAAAESVQLAADTGAGTQHAFALARLGAAAAAMGLDDECRASVTRALAVGEKTDMWSIPVYGHAALGLLALGAGDPGEAAHALDRADRAAKQSGLGHPGVVPYTGDHVEALARAGQHPEAEQALDRLQACARITQGSWELGVKARCHGLLATATTADGHFTQRSPCLNRSAPMRPRAPGSAGAKTCAGGGNAARPEPC